MITEQFAKIATAIGMVAVLDQSGGSAPQALDRFGVPDSTCWREKEMFDLVHKVRRRIIASPSYDGARILGAILSL
jgi:fructose-bisphosphate aldolase class I